MSSRFKSQVGLVLEELVKTKGFILKELGREYAGEDKKLGAWRLGDKKKRSDFPTDTEFAKYLAAYDEMEKSDLRVTKYFSDGERKASEVRFDEKGKAVGKLTKNVDGTVSGPDEIMKGEPKRKVEYVMGPLGTVHQFNNVEDKTGETLVSPISGKTLEKSRFAQHSSIHAGKAVAAAGEAELDYKGYITRISNKSGHYKPGAAQMIQLLEELARQGALLDKSYLMPGEDGKGRRLDGKPKQIFDAIEKVQAGLKKKLAAGQSIDAELAAIKRGKETLAKLGAGPANKFRDVKIEFVESADKKTGLDIRNATADDSTAEQFMRSGGGGRARTKQEKQDSLESDQVDYAEYSPAFIAKQLDISVKQVTGAEYSRGYLRADDLFETNTKLMESKGIDSVEEMYQRIRSGRPAEIVDVERHVSDLKDEVLDELTTQMKGKRKTLDKRAQSLSKELTASEHARMSRLPQTLQWYQGELAKVEANTSAKGRARQADLKRGIARIQAAMNPSDDSDVGLDMVLAELESQYEADRKSGATTVEPGMPAGFGSHNIDYDEYSIELIAERLGLTVREVKSAEADDEILYPSDLLRRYQNKIGVDSMQGLFNKLSGT